MLDGLQTAYKVTANSLYGQMGSPTSALYLKHVAACTTAVGRLMILKAKAFMEAEMGARIVYGDSVPPGTPILARLRDGRLAVLPIEGLARPGAEWREWRGGKEHTIELVAYEVWAGGAWAALMRVVRHKAGKRLFRVSTPAGVADVTEDHSLVAAEPDERGGRLVKPTDLVVGSSRLAHVPPPQRALTPPTGPWPLIDALNDPSVPGRMARLEAAFPPSSASEGRQGRRILAGLSPLEAQTLYVLGASVGRTLALAHERGQAELVVTLTLAPKDAEEGCPPPRSAAVSLVEGLPPQAAGEYVYDVETSSGVFHAGVGCLLLKNTDSIFCIFPNLDPGTGETLRGRDALVASIAAGQEASRRFRPLLKPPHDLEYEKTFFPFVLLSKKRYVGLVYEDNPDVCKQKSMGIVLKRRDNAPIVKRVYGGVIDILLNQRDVPTSASFVARTLQDLVEGRVEMDELVISKTLRSFYKDPTRIAHNVLAQRMGERDPGNKPQSNDRIPYVYVEPPPGARKNMLQGDRIEHPDFVKKNGLTPDYRHYITNQIMKPVLQIYALPSVLEQLPGYRNEPKLSGPRALADQTAAAAGDPKKGRDKLSALREREVERLLFAPVLAHPVFRKLDNARNKQNEITRYFAPRK